MKYNGRQVTVWCIKLIEVRAVVDNSCSAVDVTGEHAVSVD